MIVHNHIYEIIVSNKIYLIQIHIHIIIYSIFKSICDISIILNFKPI